MVARCSNPTLKRTARPSAFVPGHFGSAGHRLAPRWNTTLRLLLGESVFRIFKKKQTQASPSYKTPEFSVRLKALLTSSKFLYRDTDVSLDTRTFLCRLARASVAATAGAKPATRTISFVSSSKRSLDETKSGKPNSQDVMYEVNCSIMEAHHAQQFRLAHP